MDVEEMHAKLEESINRTRRLEEREAEITRQLEAVQAERRVVDATVQSVVKMAEHAQLKPSEYRQLFGDLRGEIASACSRASLAGLLIG